MTSPVVPQISRLASPITITKVGSSSTSCAPHQPDLVAPVRIGPLIVTGVIAVAVVTLVWASYGARFGLLLVIGLMLGLTLFHSRFGFSSAWQQFAMVGNGQALRAQALLLGSAATVVAVVVSAPFDVLGSKPHVNAGQLGVSLLIGAAMFGVGMQLAGSCASGTLYAVGVGQSSIVLTLTGFITGTVLYTWMYPVLNRLPAGRGILLSDHLGWFGSWALTVAALLVVVVITWFVQSRRTPPPSPPIPTAKGVARLYRGSWPMLVSAATLGVLAGGVFLVSGGVWTVTSAFELWGARLLQLFGLHPESWEFWRITANAQSLSAPLLADKATLTDIGIMIGAAVAASAAGVWKLHSGMPWRTAVAALIGGVIMGLGARMSGGCNIGAFLGGISAGNLNGWLWGACAIVGTWIGMKIRPLFGLLNPKPSESIC